MALSELQTLVDDLAQRLNAPTVLEDHEQRMIVYSSHNGGPIDDVRRDSILRREASREVRDWFQQFGIFRANSPLRIPSHPELGILGRLCAPVRFRGRLMGYLFLIDDDQRLAPPEVGVVEQAEAHAGALLYEEELAQRLSASILSNLLGPSADLRENAAQQLLEQGLAAADAPHAVVYIRPADLSAANLPELIGEVLWELGRRRNHGGLLRVARQDHGVLLVRVGTLEDDRAARLVADEARDMLAQRLAGLVTGKTASTVARSERSEVRGSPGREGSAGASRPGDGNGETRRKTGGPGGWSVPHGKYRVIAGVGDPQRHLTSAVVSYRQALLAARVSASVPGVGDVASWNSLGAFRALVQLPPGERCDSCLDPRLDKLLAADGDLAQTVETYLDLGGDAGRTAEQLNVHRATLYYRLNKAQQLTGANLRDGNDRLALHLSFKLARLIERYPGDRSAA
jgi:hypothetical protein